MPGACILVLGKEGQDDSGAGRPISGANQWVSSSSKDPVSKSTVEWLRRTCGIHLSGLHKHMHLSRDMEAGGSRVQSQGRGVAQSAVGLPGMHKASGSCPSTSLTKFCGTQYSSGSGRKIEYLRSSLAIASVRLAWTTWYPIRKRSNTQKQNQSLSLH